ncbi:MAG: hypothetical protein ACKVJE_19725 [Pseudomonadales bacterium]|jgi:hypothetical protein
MIRSTILNFMKNRHFSVERWIIILCCYVAHTANNLTVNIKNYSIMLVQENKKVNSPIWMALSDWDINAELDSDLAENIQAAFESMEQKSLIYKGSLAQLNLEYATRTVASQPMELMVHVKRFYLAMLCKSDKKVLGALIDLLIILRYRGNPLLLRLIKEAEAILGASLCETLKTIAEDKTANGILKLDVSGSVLINGCSLPATYQKRDKS